MYKFLGNFTDSSLDRIEDGQGNAWIANPEPDQQARYLTRAINFFLSE